MKYQQNPSELVESIFMFLLRYCGLLRRIVLTFAARSQAKVKRQLNCG